ncbi:MULTISPECIES: fasciclin domain-containing protein [Sphingobacterium]|uniref:FAS1 domain-containing protein n=1 Tax=Sphingobacterium cellulitidis TaxID=1768011 RepID=A0A8H9KUQ0_9SPHI|nr:MULTISPECIES: fasciclin domain-containing protein [Sphingobacterium]MBA8984939.1 putative surface protein with fasciclin (FAS1) repeats [Sphingobacterium soli]OYD40359.1 hypothetical protein CHT99_18840 [Sphingobacterium cellulitidis]OYD44905.1 hypothetical protein CHU00_14285 [Sphingobacterium cellulitidis]WFB63431.1 fasciclin domain-containing protein [Sphingobacterium sp. WM]GGE13281.1 hypothetical protein GCM10011516_08880 [Sphingobacterium soli]
MKLLKLSTLNIIALAVFCLASCKKGNDYYYNYNDEASVYDGTILKYLESKPETYDSLLLVLDRFPSIRQALDSDETFTLFAPTNRSFEIAVDALNTTRALTNKQPLYLEDVPGNDLDSLVSRYIFESELDIDELKPFIDGLNIDSYKYGYRMHAQYNVLSASGLINGGQQQIIFSDVNNSIFQRYWQNINTSAVNIKTKNGVIHVLASGHDFGFNKFTSKFSQ